MVKFLFSLLSLSIGAITVRGIISPRSNDGGGRRCKNQKCCVWYDVMEDLQSNLFDGGKCGEDAHESIRLSFHDAIGWTSSGRGGGADGSIMAHPIELSYDSNEGLVDIIHAQRKIAIKYGVSFGDFIQFANAVALTNCDFGPRILFFAGRSNFSRPAPDHLVPEPFHGADVILSRMADAGFSANEVVALLASHSVAAQDTLDKDRKGMPLDSTPGAFDTQFFLETMTDNSPDGIFRIPSDGALARDHRTVCSWQRYTEDHKSMIREFSRAMFKLSIVGQDRSLLYDCSEVIPIPKKMTFKGAKWPMGHGPKDIKVKCAGGTLPDGGEKGEKGERDERDRKDGGLKEKKHGDSGSEGYGKKYDSYDESPVEHASSYKDMNNDYDRSKHEREAKFGGDHPRHHHHHHHHHHNHNSDSYSTD